MAAMLIRLHLDSLSLKMVALAAMTTRIAPTLYVGYAIYALTLESDLSSRSDER